MSDPVVGTIYQEKLPYYPPFTQPGGIGTATIPQQGQAPPDNSLQPPGPRNELTGQFIAGCGHSFSSWLIKSQGIGGVTSAIVCCPYCEWVQNIYTPYSLIDNIPIIFG